MLFSSSPPPSSLFTYSFCVCFLICRFTNVRSTCNNFLLYVLLVACVSLQLKLAAVDIVLACN